MTTERLKELVEVARNEHLPRIQRVAATTELLDELPALIARIEEVEKMLASAREAIASLDEDALGRNWDGNDEVPGGMRTWAIRDELLHYIDSLLTPNQRGDNG